MESKTHLHQNSEHLEQDALKENSKSIEKVNEIENAVSQEPEEKPGKALNEEPDDKPAEVSQEKPEEKPDKALNEGLDDKQAEASQEKPEEKPGKALNEEPDDKPAEVSQEKPEEKPGKALNEEPDDKPAEVSQEKPEEKPDKALNEKPDDKPVEESEEKPEEKQVIALIEQESESRKPKSGDDKATEILTTTDIASDTAKDAITEEGEQDSHIGDDDKIVEEINSTDSEIAEDHEDEEDLKDEAETPEEKPESYDSCSRERLVTLIEEAVTSDDIPGIKTKIALIKVAFLKSGKEEADKKLEAFIEQGGKKEEYKADEDPLRAKFNEAFNVYKRKKAKYNEAQELLKLKNLDTKKQILGDLKELVSSEESLKATYDKFKELQGKWKDVGIVPATEINNLWQNYHFLVEKFVDKVRISRELRDLDLKKNLEKKIALCEKAEELLLETSIIKSFKQLQKYHENWKEIGPVPSDKRDEIWERFKTATDKINERRREHYTQLSEQQEKNYLAKTALCEKTEQLVTAEAKTIKEWQQKTEEVNELFKVWKSIGQAPRKHNDEIWERFRGYLNTFFAEKKEFFASLKNEQLNNYNLKLDLCQQAEVIKDSNDWKQTTNDLIKLQKEWKMIGPVPRKYSDKIWARFRAACDDFFNKKSDYFANADSREKENLAKKKELIKQVVTYKFGESKTENLETLKGFQRAWTEIGHVPIKEKDKLQNTFREAINEHLDELKISSTEIKTADYISRMESLKDNAQSDNFIRKEINFLTNKIKKLGDDIILWENNVGFLAHSKKADLLREEFEKKINKSKEDLSLLEVKLKYLYKRIR